MPFIVPAKLIAQSSPKGAPGEPTRLIRKMEKVALCIRWLNLKLSHKKESARQRVAAVFEDSDTTMKQAKAVLGDSLEHDAIASLGRLNGLQVEESNGWRPGGLTILGDSLLERHTALIGIFQSRKKYFYPVAAYRSGGMRGFAPHIYLFLPGIGELKGINPKSYEDRVRLPIHLKNHDVLSVGEIFPVKPLVAESAATQAGSDTPVVEEATKAAATGSLSRDELVEEEAIYWDPWEQSASYKDLAIVREFASGDEIAI